MKPQRLKGLLLGAALLFCISIAAAAGDTDTILGNRERSDLLYGYIDIETPGADNEKIEIWWDVSIEEGDSKLDETSFGISSETILSSLPPYLKSIKGHNKNREEWSIVYDTAEKAWNIEGKIGHRKINLKNVHAILSYSSSLGYTSNKKKPKDLEMKGGVSEEIDDEGCTKGKKDKNGFCVLS